METIFFILGVLMVLVICGIIGTFITWKKAFNAYDEAHSVWDGIDALNNDLGGSVKNLEEAIHYTSDDIKKMIETTDSRVDAEIDELYKHIDSRFDKFETRLMKNLKEDHQNSKPFEIN